MAPPERGYLISIEGIDGAGKTTQVGALAGALRRSGREVELAPPAGTSAGQVILAALLAHEDGRDPVDPWTEALLFMAGRAQLVRDRILPALARGAVVVADRYVDSTLAYQGCGRGLDLEELRRLHRVACGDVWPDLTVWLDVPLTVAGGRRADGDGPRDRIEAAADEFHVAVREGFARLAEAAPDRIVRIDGSGPVADVSADVIAAVDHRLRPRDRGSPCPELRGGHGDGAPA